MLKKLSLIVICISLLFSTLPAQADGPEPITLGLGTLTSIAISPDGARLAASSHDGTILIWPVP
jgi:WD40 repeat protein